MIKQQDPLLFTPPQNLLTKICLIKYDDDGTEVGGESAPEQVGDQEQGDAVLVHDPESGHHVPCQTDHQDEAEFGRNQQMEVEEDGNVAPVDGHLEPADKVQVVQLGVLTAPAQEPLEQGQKGVQDRPDDAEDVSGRGEF